MEITPIGIIHSPFKRKEDCPIQPRYSDDATAEIEIYPQFADGLKDIEGFSHIFVIYRLDKAGEIKLVRPTFLDDEPHGIYSSRHPCRPNGIGLSVVRLIERNGSILTIKEFDMLDGTPVLDLKPYVSRFDSIPDAAEGWISDKTWRPKPSNRE